MTRLLLEPLSDGRSAKLERELIYFSSLLNDKVIVPSGFVTDYASVPRGLWNLFPPMGRYNEAAVVHDYLYETKKVSRYQADRVFLEAMGVKGCRATQRWAMFLAVRAFGWVPWMRK